MMPGQNLKTKDKNPCIRYFSQSPLQTCASAYIVSCHKCHRSTKFWLEIQKFQKTKSLILIMKNKRKVSLYLYQESWAQRNSSHLACCMRATGLQFLVTFIFFFGFQWGEREHILGKGGIVLSLTQCSWWISYFFFFCDMWYGNTSVEFNNCWWSPNFDVLSS